MVRKAVAPAFSQAAMKANFAAIRLSAEAAAAAMGRICEISSSVDGTASVNVDNLAAATAMDVITAFGFGVRSNAVERLGAKLAEEERAKTKEKGGGEGKSFSPIPVPAPSIPGAEDTVDAMHAATEAAELYVVWGCFRMRSYSAKKFRVFFLFFFLALSSFLLFGTSKTPPATSSSRGAPGASSGSPSPSAGAWLRW